MEQKVLIDRICDNTDAQNFEDRINKWLDKGYVVNSVNMKQDMNPSNNRMYTSVIIVLEKMFANKNND